MKFNKTPETIRLYLLGQATQEDSSWVEEQLFADSALLQELQIVEDELIDEYLSDKLTPAERQKFEGHFLIAPERQQKLRFGRALHKYVDFAGTTAPVADYAAENTADEKVDVAKLPRKRNEWINTQKGGKARGRFPFLPFSNPEFSNPVVAYSLAAAMLLIVAGVSWVVLNNWRQQTQPGNVFAVTLTPGLTRDGGELKRVSIPPGSGTLQLKLLLRSDEEQSYRAELLTSERASVWLIDDLKPQTLNSERFVILSIPANILKREDYEVRLSSRQSDGTYQVIDRYQLRVNE